MEPKMPQVNKETSGEAPSVPETLNNDAIRLARSAAANDSNISKGLLALGREAYRLASGVPGMMPKDTAIAYFKGATAHAEHIILTEYRTANNLMEKNADGKMPAVSLSVILPSWKVIKSHVLKGMTDLPEFRDAKAYPTVQSVHVATRQGRAPHSNAHVKTDRTIKGTDQLRAVLTALIVACEALSDEGQNAAAVLIHSIVPTIEAMKEGKAGDPVPVVVIKTVPAKDAAKAAQMRGGTK